MQKTLSELDVYDLDDMFVRSHKTERALPSAIRKQKLVAWPEYAQSWQSYGWEDFNPRPPRPSAQDVTNFELCISLIIKAPIDDRKIIWACCASAATSKSGLPNWSKVGRLFSRSRTWAKQEYMGALIRMTWILKQKAGDEPACV
jgi:hypothetical protein